MGFSPWNLHSCANSSTACSVVFRTKLRAVVRSAQVKLAPPVYLMFPGSHISTPMWVLFPLAPQCQARMAFPAVSRQGMVMMASSSPMKPWTQARS